MYWNHRIVQMSEGSNDDPWCELREVYYNDDNSIAGHASPCLGSEYPEQIIEVLQRMIDDIKANSDVVLPSQAVGTREVDEVEPF